jgi:hypothetical protein
MMGFADNAMGKTIRLNTLATFLMFPYIAILCNNCCYRFAGMS